MCLPAIKKCCQFANFSTSFSERFFIPKKIFFNTVLTLKANFFYITDHVALFWHKMQSPPPLSSANYLE